jgi:hypothetical protein
LTPSSPIPTTPCSPGTIVSTYGWPVGGPNDGFGIGLADGGSLPDVLPISIPVGATGTGFDETISSKRMIPEPVTLLLLAFGGLILPRRKRNLPNPEPSASLPPSRGPMLAIVALLICGLAAAPTMALTVIPAGSDMWTTPSGAAHHNFALGPVPADFFDPGSDPFEGDVIYDGLPLVANPADALSGADTIVERLTDTTDLDAGPSTVDIEIVALSLVGVNPITVTYNGGLNPEEWNVAVCLSPSPQPVGSMTITKTHPDGGTFDSTLPVVPLFTFTRVSDGAVRELDCGQAGCPQLVLTGNGNSWALVGGPRTSNELTWASPSLGLPRSILIATAPRTLPEPRSTSCRVWMPPATAPAASAARKKRPWLLTESNRPGVRPLIRRTNYTWFAPCPIACGSDSKTRS